MADEEQNALSGEEVAEDQQAEEQPAAEAAEAPVDVEPSIEEAEQLKQDIAALKAQKEEAEKAAKEWARAKRHQRDEFFKEKTGQQPAAPAAEAPAAKEPVESDFETYDDFRDAREDWKINQALERYKSESAQQQQAQSMGRFVGEMIQKGSEKYEDFAAVATYEGNPTLPITNVMIDLLREFEEPEDIAYYLGKNPMECTQISQMSPVQAARKLAKIEAEIGNEKAKLSEPGQKPITKAPEPIKPTKSGNVVTKDPEKMTQAEYEEWRKSEGARLF